MKIKTSSCMAVKPMSNRRGATLIMAMLVLAMLTIMGVYSATRSSLEQNIAKNLETDMSLFFAAEAGLHHAFTLLEGDFGDANGSSLTPSWNFALNNDAVYGYGSTATNYHYEGVDTGDSMIDGPWVGNGVQVIQRSFPVGNITVTYTVNLWDNNDADAANSDDDGLIYIRSTAVAVAPDGVTVISTAIQEMTLSGTSQGLGIIDGIGQEFGSSGKSSSDDSSSPPIDLSGGTVAI